MANQRFAWNQTALFCGQSLIALIEALLKCLPVFCIQLLAILPLVTAGQGREAMRALLDPGPANISWILFPLSLIYSYALTASFLFFLLDRWNYSADNLWRAFCRIWVPATLTLTLALMWPIAAELNSQQSNLWDAMLGLLACVNVFAMVVGAWWHVKTADPPRTIGTIFISALALLGAFILLPIVLFYIVAFIAVTTVCWTVREDFQDQNPKFQPWSDIHPITLCFAALYTGVIVLLSLTSVTWRMFLGSPTAVMCGFSLMIAVVFLLTALLSRASRVLVRFGWLALIVVLFSVQLNHEPLRVLPEATNTPERLVPSKHFHDWLNARPQVQNSATPYPVFVIAAKGGGVRAAYWTATLLAGLEERYPGFTDHVYAISGVSGGSVGGAVYAAMYRDLLARSDQKCAPLEEKGVQGLRPCAAYLFSWDLLGPPLSGLLLNDLPFLKMGGVRRAKSLEEGLEFAWFGTMETTLFEQPFQELWREKPFSVPSLILNTTSADDGRRFVVSNLAAHGELTAEPDVEELLGRPVRLSTAAILSARFPMISPLATFDSKEGNHYRMADGGYFDNSGLASTADLLRAISPVASSGEYAGKVRLIILEVANSPSTITDSAPPAGSLAGSLAGAIYSPVSVLQETAQAHEETYLHEVEALVGKEWVAQNLRPSAGSREVALGWMLSAQTRCEMDEMVNDVINGSSDSNLIGSALGQNNEGNTSWTSCSSTKNH